MTASFRSPSVAVTCELPDTLEPFTIWLAKNRAAPRAESLLVLLAEHDREDDELERDAIRRTILEILANEPVLGK